MIRKSLPGGMPSQPQINPSNQHASNQAVDTPELREMEKYMHGVTSQERQQWLRLRNQAEQFSTLLKRWAAQPVLPEEAHRRITTAQAKLSEVLQKHLNYKRRYTISVAGATGAGKSTLINALIGLNLLATAKGDSITGTLVTVRQVEAADFTPWTVSESPPSERGNASEQPYGQARFQYYTLDTLTELVAEQCELLGKLPLARSEGDPQRLDVATMLTWIGIWSNGDAITCAQCGQVPSQKARFCSECGAPVAPDPQVTANQPGILPSLEKLLRTAQNHLDAISQSSWEEVFLLYTGEDLQYLHDAMNELSDRNRDEATRIVPLLERIECEIIAQPHSDALLQVDLTDVPGSAASNILHEQRVRRYLDPRNVDAVMLVMDDERPGRAKDELAPMVQKALSSISDPNDLRTAAERTFLVVSTRDRGRDVLGDFQRNVETAVRSVADAIIPGIYNDREWRETKIMDRVMARSGLISQVVRVNKSQAARWRNGERTPFLPPLLEDEPFFSSMARVEKQTGQSEETTVLQWSGIPELREKLRNFLSRSRWDIDIRKAQTLYNEAYAGVAVWLRSEWKQVTGGEATDNPETDFNLLSSDSVERYIGLVQDEAQTVLERFRRVRNTLSRDSEAATTALKDTIITDLQTQMIKIVSTVKTELEDYAERPAFRDALFKATQNWRGRFYREPSFAEELDKLETFILDQFDLQVVLITDTMAEQWRVNLDKEAVEQHLVDTCTDLPDAMALINAYRLIISETSQQYKNACRGVLLYEMMHHQVMDEIMTGTVLRSTAADAERQDAPPSYDGTSASTAARSVLTRVELDLQHLIIAYDRTHQHLAEPLPERLYELFLYHLTSAEQAIGMLMHSLKHKLVSEVAQHPRGALALRLRARDKDMFTHAETLTELRRDMESLRL